MGGYFYKLNSLGEMMINKIQKLDIKYRIWKNTNLRKFGDAITILKYAIKMGKFPHGDYEYNQILNQEVQK